MLEYLIKEGRKEVRKVGRKEEKEGRKEEKEGRKWREVKEVEGSEGSGGK
jgi:hypothetical protein